jgi:D-alanyl-lipoteichoic acid acyltransferase DltB (MBOAT superfamily)
VTATSTFDRLLAVGSLLLAGRSGMFLRFVAASVAFVIVAAMLRRLSAGARTVGEVVISLVLIAALTTPLLAALMAAYALAFFWLVEHAPLGRARGAVVVVFLSLQVIAPIFWLPGLPGYAGAAREFIAFATNATLLRAWGYAYDRLRRPDPVVPTLRDYALFTFFFPAFVNGPLVSFADFQRRRLRDASIPAGPAMVRIGVGLLALALVQPLAGVLGPSHYAAAAAGGAGTAWAHVIGVYVAVYLGFTAWTEAAIGFGRLGGMALPENFDAPHLAWGAADFWRRWNITLGHWLRSYVYLPLGGAYPRRLSGARRLEWLNTAAVFGVMAVYHVLGGLKLLGPGLVPPHAWVPWIVWASLNTLGVLATRRLVRPARLSAGSAVVIAATLAFACVGHMTAFFPPALGLDQLAAIFRHLFVPGVAS